MIIIVLQSVPQSLKFYQKVSYYNIASEVSYVYNLVENIKNGQFSEFLKNLRSSWVTRQDQIGEKCQKLNDSNETFWKIFKHCTTLQIGRENPNATFFGKFWTQYWLIAFVSDAVITWPSSSSTCTISTWSLWSLEEPTIQLLRHLTHLLMPQISPSTFIHLRYYNWLFVGTAVSRTIVDIPWEQEVWLWLLCTTLWKP